MVYLKELKDKTTLWWNDQVKKSIKEKRFLYKKWQKRGDSKSKELQIVKKRLRELWLRQKKMEGKIVLINWNRTKHKSQNAYLEWQDKAKKKTKILMKCRAFVVKLKYKNEFSLEEKKEVWKTYEEKLLNETKELSGVEY